MKTLNMKQGSPDWIAARLGVPTASQFHRIITPKGKSSTAREGYMYELIAERLLGVPASLWKPDLNRIPWVREGREREPLAARELQRLLNVKLDTVGFVTTDDGKIGASPDRLITHGNMKAGVEIKCPTPPTHIGYLLAGLGEDYKAQVQGQMWVAELDAIHFYSWHPECPDYYLMTQRDDAFIEDLSRVVKAFVVELDEKTEKARSLGTWGPRNINGEDDPDEDS